MQWAQILAASAGPLTQSVLGGPSESLTTILQLISTGLNLGLAGLVIWWFFSGKLHSDDEMAAVRKDLETTQAALERTRDALMLSNARNETGTLSAEIIAQALGVSRHREEDDDHRSRRRSGASHEDRQREGRGHVPSEED